MRDPKSNQVRLAVLIAITFFSGSSLQAEDRPNILLMFTDDQPQSCLGFVGNEHIRTPHLDMLAKRGTFFNNAFVTTAICCSSRACLLTGQHMYRHGITEFKTPLCTEAFEQTYPAILKRAGYRTGYLGKYAIGNPGLGDRELSLPKDKFDYWYGFPQSISFRQNVDGKPRYLTEVMTEKAAEFLQATKPNEPFCLTVAFKEPHGPFSYFDPNTPNVYMDVNIPPPATFTQRDFDAQPEFIRKSLNGDGSLSRLQNHERFRQDIRTFYRTVTRADAAVGEIMAELKRLKLDHNTVVIFTSDHGSLLGDHGLFGKWLMYENSIKVPLIIFDPRITSKVASGRRDEIALGIDLAPTMLSLAGIAAPAAMQGRDLMPIVRRESTKWRSEFYYEHTYNTNPPRAPIAKCEGIRNMRWKYTRYPDSEPLFEQLFDLDADPLEQTNLAGDPEQAELLNELRSKCDKWKTMN